MIEWLQKNKQFLSIRAIEQHLEMPDSSLIKAVKRTQNLPNYKMERFNELLEKRRSLTASIFEEEELIEISKTLNKEQLKDVDKPLLTYSNANRLDLLNSKIELKLQQIKTRQLQLKKGALLILKHLDKKVPLAVKRGDFIVVVTDDNISIERNVL